MTALRLVQGTPEWLEARRSLVTATDIPVLLGLSPYKCEADLADEKLGITTTEASLAMRVGSALEPVILDAWEEETGQRAVRFRQMVVHPEIPWAAASPDARVIGRRCLLELKHTANRDRFAFLPQDVEAQVAWQLGCSGYPEAEVVALTGYQLARFPVKADPQLFAHLVTVAERFRERLAAGGPFERDKARIERDHPTDDGTEMVADAELAEAVAALLDVKEAIKRHEATSERLEAAIKARMGDAAVLVGGGFRVTWKGSKDRTTVDWGAVAGEYRRQLEELGLSGLDAVEAIHSTVKPGPRAFRVYPKGE